ncbi:MAG: AbrB/MazE/SpoVT family DNA-binding protein [Flavipsychrobacter sp.]|jgi:antitoxin MazE|nr:AbrB/MazE/SpoVT family DNA-binding protein [Flavipsychrobacter sp.]
MIVKIQKFGNSKGIILPKQVMAMCSIEDQVSISVEDNHIVIAAVNEPRAGWEEQFKAAIAKGEKPEKDFSEGMKNDFDKNEWTW